MGWFPEGGDTRGCWSATNRWRMCGVAIQQAPGAGMSGWLRTCGDELQPVLRSSRIYLRPATRADGTTLYGLLLDLGLNTLPTLDQWIDGGIASRNANAQFVIHRVSDESVVGFSALYELDGNAGHIKAGVYTGPNDHAPGVGAEACIFTINYAFAMWNLRKVYFHTTEASLGSLGQALSRVAQQEAVLPEYQYFRGRLWDLYIYAIHRSEWETVGRPLAERLFAGAPLEAGNHGAGRNGSRAG